MGHLWGESRHDPLAVVEGRTDQLVEPTELVATVASVVGRTGEPSVQ